MSVFQNHLILISTSEIRMVSISNLTPIGGKNSSGISLKSLKKSEDYLIISPGGDGINILNLNNPKDKKNIPVNETYIQDDLKIFVLDSNRFETQTQYPKTFRTLSHILGLFSATSDLKEGMKQILESLLESLEMEKGIIITKLHQGNYEVSCQSGVSENDPWLSESIVQETLKSMKPVIVQNVLGSGYDQSKSLIAAGFLSVFSFPLVLRGETLGVLLVGSMKPHSGISQTQREIVDLFITLATLLLSQHLKDAILKAEFAAIQKQNQNGPFLSQNKKMNEICDYVTRIAPTNLSVLILGETGVGKEVLAKWIHQHSDRNRGPFVAVNCGAIPENLLESVLFGHKKGSFTGAVTDQIGKFQLANGGTLFLDEVGDLPKDLQVKLLRALQERVIEPIGSQRGIPVDLRIISATHKPILSLVESSQFREDFYYRLAEISVEIPALRQRPEDIELIAISILKEINPKKTFSHNAINLLKTQEWKGNVRELSSSIRRAAVLSRTDEIQVQDLSSPQLSHKENQNWLKGSNLNASVDLFIIEKVKQALALSEGKRQQAADLLGITPRTLFRYLEQYKNHMNELSESMTKPSYQPPSNEI